MMSPLGHLKEVLQLENLSSLNLSKFLKSLKFLKSFNFLFCIQILFILQYSTQLICSLVVSCSTIFLFSLYAFLVIQHHKQTTLLQYFIEKRYHWDQYLCHTQRPLHLRRKLPNNSTKHIRKIPHSNTNKISGPTIFRNFLMLFIKTTTYQNDLSLF